MTTARGPGRPPDPVPPTEIDFAEPQSLVRLALSTRIDSLRPAVKRGDIEGVLGCGGLKEWLKAKLADESSDVVVERLQGYLQVVEGRRRDGPGPELAAYRKQILRRSPGSAIGLQVPGTFFRRLAQGSPRSIEDTLVAGAAILGIREQVSTSELLKELHEANRDELVEVVERLVVASCLPHAELRVTLTLTAQLREWALPAIGRHLRHSPIAHRCIRLLTRMLRNPPDGPQGRTLWEQIERVLRSRHLWAPDLDPARGFFEEALRYTPGWDKRRLYSQGMPPSPWKAAWIPELLADTVKDADAPVRQRTFAALCLAEGGSRARRDAVRLLEVADDPSGGLGHAAECIRNLATRDSETRRRFWQDTGAASALGRSLNLATGEFIEARKGPLTALPGSVREAILHVALYAVFSPDITRRRMACDTLTAAGAGGPVSDFIAQIALAETCPEFLREVCAVVLGYMGDTQGISGLCGLATSAARSHETRRAAVMALGEVRADPDQQALPVLGAALHDDSLANVALFASASRIRQDLLSCDDAAALRASCVDIRTRVAALRADGGPGVKEIAKWAHLQIQDGPLPQSPLRGRRSS